MATESEFITLEDLKRQPGEIGLDGKEKTKFLTQRWKMIQESEVRKLKLAAEAEERKLKLAAKPRKRNWLPKPRKRNCLPRQRNGTRKENTSWRWKSCEWKARD